MYRLDEKKDLRYCLKLPFYHCSVNLLYRKAELQARDIAERAPDVSVLGGLFDPSKPATMQPIRPSDVRKSYSNTSSQEEPGIDPIPNDLFISKHGSPVPEPPLSTISPAPTSQQQSSSRPLVCFFWDRWCKDNRQPPCGRGPSCQYDHTHHYGQPVAAPPDGFVSHMPDLHSPTPGQTEPVISDAINSPPGFHLDSAGSFSQQERSSRPLVCFFWDRWNQSSANPPCGKGLNCMFDHTHEHGQPVAPPPPGYIFQDSDGSAPPAGEADRSISDATDPTPIPHPAISTTSNDQRPPNPKHFVCAYWNAAERDPRNPPCKLGVECKNLHTHVGSYPVARLVCFFWDRAQKNTTNPPCSNGDSCTFLHAYEDDLRVAPQPKSWQQPTRRPPWNKKNPFNAICYFMFNDGRCKKANVCKYLHSIEENTPIAPAPWVVSAVTPCKFWLEGYCEKGERCSFLHEYSPSDSDLSRAATSSDYQSRAEVAATPAPPTNAPRKSVKFLVDDDSMLFTDEPGRISPRLQAVSRRPDTGRSTSPKKVCQHFLRGECRFGNRCQDLHEDTSANHDPLPFNRLERDDRALINSKTSIADGDVDMLRSEVSDLDIVSTWNQPPNSRVKRTIKMDDFKGMKTLDTLGTRAKEVFFGSDNNQSVMLDFGDIGSLNHDSWKHVFTSTYKIVFDRLCLAEDMRTQQGFLQRFTLLLGALVADPSDTRAGKVIDQVVDELAIRAAGLVAMFPEFAILLFPAKKEEWRFLEHSEYPAEPRLRYLIFKHDFEPSNPSSELQFGEPYKKTLMDKIHGLRLEKLLPVYDKEKGHNPFKFFLLFPASQQQDSDFFAAWIRASYAESQIYDSRSKGSWDFFVKSNNEYGVILIHEAITGSIYKMPFLNRLINKYANIAIWNVSDPSSAFPAFPSTSLSSGLGRVRLTRLFPHGCAFFLTPSFLIAEPEMTYEILKWFLLGLKPKYSNVTPGTWKLVCCFGFADYVLELANSKASEKESFEIEHKDKPAKDSMLNEKKLSFNHCEIRYKIHKALVAWEMKQPLDSDSNSDSDITDNDVDMPIVKAPKWIDPDDEEQLINWFSGWALQKMDLYRKFGIIGTNSSNATRASRLKEVAQQMQMKELKATSSWYRDLSEAGNGWEHVNVVTDWNAIKQFLGMK